jgi:hypothetical protein
MGAMQNLWFGLLIMVADRLRARYKACPGPPAKGGRQRIEEAKHP